jgi:hypothetical protein
VSPRLHPIDFFENWGRSRSLFSRQKNLKKIMGEGNEFTLKATKIRSRILNRLSFLEHSEKWSKKICGQPDSPVPSLKNLKKIQSVEIHSVLEATEFCCRVCNRF